MLGWLEGAGVVDPRISLLDDEARSAVEAVAPGALEGAVEAQFRALDALSCDVLRALAMDMVQNANSGHPGGPCSSMDFAYVLHAHHLRHSRDATWMDRDRFVLSGGHMSTLLYSLLHLEGHLSLEDLKNFRQLGAPTQGHPVAGFAPGIETTTGPLGQGFANGVGMALGEHLARETFGPELVNHRTWVLATDGDIQEGLCREAAQLAGLWGLGHLNVFFDSNDIQLASPTDRCWAEDVGAAFRACGWHVIELADGHDHKALDEAIEACIGETAKPSMIIGKTQIAKGTTMEGSVKTHGSPLGDEVIAAYKKAKGHPGETFWVPEVVGKSLQPNLDRGDKAQAEWDARRKATELSEGALAARWQAFYGEGRGEGILQAARAAVHALEFDGKLATRAAAGKAQGALAEAVPCLVGGSADLANSTKTDVFEKAVGYLGDSDAGDGPAPRGIHFGVREHAMASIANGLALEGGWLSYAGTFLVFSDYLRGAIRLGAISKLPVTYVFTHDSFLLGEDGETHQPVEHTESLRLIPGVRVLRPADAYEAAEAWLYAIERHLSPDPAPVALVLSRQGLPTLPGGFERAAGLHRGGYVVRECDGMPDVELVATGSEVSLALEAAEALGSEGVAVKVISMPCRELFLEQSPEERARVLDPACPFRVVLEAGRVSGWGGVGGELLETVAVDGYGESAPAAQLAESRGFTGAQVASRVKELLGARQERLIARMSRDAAYMRAKFPEAAGAALAKLGGGEG